MLVLIIIFLSAIFSLFSGVYNQGKISRYIAILGLIVAFCVSFTPELSFFNKYQHMFYFSKHVALFSKISILTTIGIFSLGSLGFSNQKNHQSELYSLMLFSLCGGIIILGFESLVTLFIGIEILSIPLYVLAGSEKNNNRSVEASIKYFLMGSFVTGFLLFGITLIYGSVGSFDMKVIRSFDLANQSQNMLMIGVILLIIALAFKVSLIPFHMWSPDVYDGSPSLITTFMATILKTTVFYTFFKLIFLGFPNIFQEYHSILYALVVITIILANILALIQTNLKRLIAYSSISHAGFIALIFFGTNLSSIYSLAFYLFAYCISTIGIFAGVIFIEKSKQNLSIESLKGLAKEQPILSVEVSICLFSLAGIPLTAGFIGKFYLLNQVFVEYKLLGIIGIIGSIISIAYYLKLIMFMFLYEKTDTIDDKKITLPIQYNVVSIIIVIITIILGFYPKLFYLLY